MNAAHLCAVPVLVGDCLSVVTVLLAAVAAALPKPKKSKGKGGKGAKATPVVRHHGAHARRARDAIGRVTLLGMTSRCHRSACFRAGRHRQGNQGVPRRADQGVVATREGVSPGGWCTRPCVG